MSIRRPSAYEKEPDPGIGLNSIARNIASQQHSMRIAEDGTVTMSFESLEALRRQSRIQGLKDALEVIDGHYWSLSGNCIPAINARITELEKQ